jgi:pimeloyl-ACP methyl ester carboxylesterase
VGHFAGPRIQDHRVGSPHRVSLAHATVTLSRGRRRRRIVALAVLAALLLAVIGFVGYASLPQTAKAAPLAAVRADPAIHLTETGDGIVLTPASGATGTGLVFLAGAHIDPAAYAYKLSGLADAGVTVVIARPILNLAILDWRPLRIFTGLAPGVATWYVGGHSLGGVRACQYAKDDYAVAGVVLVGSYCSADLSESSIPVLSVAGSRDGLSTQTKIRDAARLLPVDAQFVEITGADHASFGDYGEQAGDNAATARDSSVRSQLTTVVLTLVG